MKRIVKKVRRDRRDHIVNLILITGIIWSFDMYWIAVSGWTFLWQPKLCVALFPFVSYYIYLRIELARLRHYRNKRKAYYRKKVMLKHTIRNLKDPA